MITGDRKDTAIAIAKEAGVLKAETDLVDDLYHNIACRSAIKGGNIQSAAELEEFARKILSNNDIMYCPHGRPVAFELTRNELEKQFGRTK